MSGSAECAGAYGYLTFIIETWLSGHTVLGSNLFDLALAQPNRAGKELALTPQFLVAQALRYRHLAAKARREANAVSGDPIAPRLIALAEKLEGDAVRDEEEARILLAEQDEATPLRQHAEMLQRRAEVAKRPRHSPGGGHPVKSSAAMTSSAGYHAQDY